ncbi:MAG: ATP-binding cassette domain-containing protein [Syntrophobacterales bacterium]|jgi:phospholipid/cholesterol/gamma-HCH transport system ATP-binding protein|nr:ATP-binding cassette domain-containing protein [Syntrophobacterales bacterium]
MNSDSDIVISVEGLTVRYGENTILDNVSLQVHRGEILIIAGGSGCGKSTLLKHIIGLSKPSGGRVVINGIDITTATYDKLKDLRKEIGMLFQSSALFGSMTIAENISLSLATFTDLSAETIELITKMKLGMVGLAGYENHFPAELSGGMQKRAGIARAMAMDPRILFFDEPSAGLDPITAAGIDNLIKSLNRGMGTTMVIVTHELQSIFAVAQRIVMLDKSKKGVIAVGNPLELKEKSTDPMVKNFFNRQSA